MSQIGFIGVGKMGKPMAQNLLASGHSVKVYDLSTEAMKSLVTEGAVEAKSPSDTASGVDYVITMLPTGKEVKEIFLSSDVMTKANENTIFLDCSTIDVEDSLSIHSVVKEAGFDMLDAPVSGGMVGAEQATLTFMCGGERAVFENCRKIFELMGKNIVFCGGPGKGQATKICNNMVAGSIFLATAEAFVLGEKLCVNRQVIFDVMSKSSGSSWVLENTCPLPGGKPGSQGSKDFKPGFTAQLMLKDLRLSQAAAKLASSSTPLGAAVTAAFQQHVNNGHGQLDTASICLLVDPEIT